MVGIELWFLYTALPLNVVYLYVKFEVTSFCTLEVMPQTKIQRAITPKIVGIELWFLYTVLLHNVTYLCMKFALILFKLCSRQDF